MDSRCPDWHISVDVGLSARVVVVHSQLLRFIILGILPILKTQIIPAWFGILHGTSERIEEVLWDWLLGFNSLVIWRYGFVCHAGSKGLINTIFFVLPVSGCVNIAVATDYWIADAFNICNIIQCFLNALILLNSKYMFLWVLLVGSLCCSACQRESYWWSCQRPTYHPC